MTLKYDTFVKLQLVCHPEAVVQYTFTHKQCTEQHNRHKQYIEQHKKFWKSAGRAPSLRVIPWGKNLSQGSRRVPAGTMKIHKHTVRIHRHNNKNT